MANRFLAIALAATAAALLLAACGGGSSSSSSSSDGPSPGSAETTEAANKGNGSAETSRATLVPAPSETEPTEIPAGLTPLPKAPKTGITVVNMQCDLPTCGSFSKVFIQAGKALGWNVKTIVFKTGQPQAAMTQAVNTPGAEYVTIAGIPAEIIEPQLKVAEEKGIKVMSCCDPGPPRPPVLPVQIANLKGTTVISAEEIARWMINDSDGNATSATVNLPEVPINAPVSEVVTETFEKECPGCSNEEIPYTGEELAAGTVPAKVIAYLQSHPETDYVLAGFGGVLNGLPQAIQAAGLSDKVKVVCRNSIEAPESEMLAHGEVQACYVGGQGEWGAMWADAIARDSEGLPLPQKVYEAAPQHWLCTTKTAKQCFAWNGPQGFLSKYEKLWKVG